MKKFIVLSVIAITCSLANAQDSVKQDSDLEKLKTEIAGLAKENDKLIKQNADLARELLLLKETMRGFLQETSQKKDAEAAPKESAGEKFPAPKDAIKGSVLVVSKETGKVVIRPGSDDGVKAGYRFQILKDALQVAVIEIDKVVERYSIGRVIFGAIGDIKADYDAVSIVPKPAAMGKVSQPAVEAKAGAIQIQNPALVIKGDLGNGRYVVNCGRGSGVGEKDVVTVYGSDKVYKATLGVEKVEDDFAVAKLLDGGSVEINDMVEVKHAGADGLEGLVRIKNDKLIAIDIGTKKGAQVGQRFKILHEGKPITEVTLKELYDDWALIEPIDETKSSEITVGDKVIELKSASGQ